MGFGVAEKHFKEIHVCIGKSTAIAKRELDLFFVEHQDSQGDDKLQHIKPAMSLFYKFSRNDSYEKRQRYDDGGLTN